MKPAPIIIFTYKRLGTLMQTIDTLKDNSLASKSELFIFSDGPKNQNDANSVNQVRDYIKQIDGFKSVKYVFSETNKGLASSVISGVSDVFRTYNSAIVLEDDLLLTPNFLAFMNQALDTYVSSDKVFSISGYSFSLNPSSKDNDDAYFLNRGWSWGWATWKDRWEQIDWEVKDYHEFEKNIELKKAFNKGGSDLSAMLHKQMTNKLDSWGIRWLYHQFRINGITLYPKNSKILNIGFDSQATHTTGSDSRYIPKLDTSLKEVFKFPDKVEITKDYQNAFQRKMGIASRIKSRIDTAIKHSKNKVSNLFSKNYADKTGKANFVEIKKN